MVMDIFLLKNFVSQMLLYLYASFGFDIAEAIDMINATYGDDPGVRDAISGLVYAIDKERSAIEVDKVVYRGSDPEDEDSYVQQLQ